MLISTRDAARMLAPLGINRAMVTRVLATGLAGEPVRAGRTSYWERASVEALREQETLDKPTLDDLFSWGPFVARRDIDLHLPAERRLDQLADGWGFSRGTRLWLRAGIFQRGTFPLVATTGGFITVGADIVDALPTEDRSTHLELRPPGPWFVDVAGKRLPTGPGRQWAIHGLGPFSHDTGMTAESLNSYLRDRGRLPPRPWARGRIGP